MDTISLALAEAGADVVVAARTVSEIESTAEQVQALGRRSMPVRADVSNPDEVDALVDRTLEAFGKVDIMVNNAVASIKNNFLYVTEEDWEGSTFITNGARQNMWLWTSNTFAFQHSMGSDWDNRWRTGGSLDEIIAESRLDPESLWEGITLFAQDVKERQKISDQTEV